MKASRYLLTTRSEFSWIRKSVSALLISAQTLLGSVFWIRSNAFSTEAVTT